MKRSGRRWLWAGVATALCGAEAHAQSVEVEVYGACPGGVTVEIDGVLPGSCVGVGRGHAVGDGYGHVISKGVCRGSVLALAPAERVGSSADLCDDDEDGFITLSKELGEDACGVSFQVIDLEDCEVSNLARVPDEEGAPSVTEAYPYYGAAYTMGLWYYIDAGHTCYTYDYTYVHGAYASTTGLSYYESLYAYYVSPWTYDYEWSTVYGT